MSVRESLDPDRSLWDLIAVDLRRQREAHNLAGSRLAALFGCDRSTVSRYESGILKLTEKHAKIADREWHTEGLFTRLVRFAKAGNGEDWFVGLTEYEAVATRFKMWEVALVPGLLQTPEYARAVLAVGLVDDLDDAVQKRMARQAVVFGRPKPPHMTVILNWVVLEQPIGSPEIMRGQMARLLEAGALPNVSVRVLERDAGAHIGLDGSCWLLTVDDRDIAYADAPQRGRIVRDPSDVQGFAVRFDRIGDIAAPVGPDRKSDRELHMTEWRKSSRSGTSDNMACVEVANVGGNIGVRDSKTPTGPILTFDLVQFGQFFGRIKRDEI